MYSHLRAPPEVAVGLVEGGACPSARVETNLGIGGVGEVGVQGAVDGSSGDVVAGPQCGPGGSGDHAVGGTRLEAGVGVSATAVLLIDGLAVERAVALATVDRHVGRGVEVEGGEVGSLDDGDLIGGESSLGDLFLGPLVELPAKHCQLQPREYIEEGATTDLGTVLVSEDILNGCV